jgi:carbamoyltransferase
MGAARAAIASFASLAQPGYTREDFQISLNGVEIMKSDPWILGIGASPHNGAMCLIKGDEIVVAIQEERLSRKKRDQITGAAPSLALDYCLSYAGIRPSDLSMVVSCVTNQAKIPGQDVSRNPILQTKLNKIPILYIPHHYGHAVSAFATSGYKDAAILVIDGVGSPYEDFTEDEKKICTQTPDDGWETISLYSASESSITAIEKHVVDNFGWITASDSAMYKFGSLGGMYSAAAEQIFGDIFEAGKVMGLAPYGEPEIPISEFYEIEDRRFNFCNKVQDRFSNKNRWPLLQKEYVNLASSTQAALERAVLYLVEHLHAMYPGKNLCYAGGVALNSVANERIIRESPFKSVYIIPAAEDSGTAIGAAYYGLWQLTKLNGKRKLVHDAVGREYSPLEILSAIEKTPAVQLIKSRDVLSDAVELLCDGNIVGWFQGRSELGPRALGQRSILCDARRPDGKDVLNSRVKHRESFRPFAPVVLLDKVSYWFDVEGVDTESRFMLRICKFKDDKAELVPAVVHVDDTGRFQTLTKEANGLLYALVEKFYEKTDVPIILNTSFNVAGEPIVETPEDALATLLSTGIDYCVLGNNLVGKRKEILFEQNEIPWPVRTNEQITNALKAMAESNKESDNATELPSERSLENYAGTFENERSGSLTIDLQGQRLTGSYTSGLSSAQYIKWSSPLKHLGHNVFEVEMGRFEGTKLIFAPDTKGNIDAVGVLVRADSRSIIFTRRPNRTRFDKDLVNRFVGEYTAAGKIMTISLRENKFIASVPGQAGFELSPRKDNEFNLKNLPGHSVEFKLDSSSRVTGAIVTQPSGVVILQKQ